MVRGNRGSLLERVFSSYQWRVHPVGSWSDVFKCLSKVLQNLLHSVLHSSTCIAVWTFERSTLYFNQEWMTQDLSSPSLDFKIKIYSPKRREIGGFCGSNDTLWTCTNTVCSCGMADFFSLPFRHSHHLYTRLLREDMSPCGPVNIITVRCMLFLKFCLFLS